MLIVYLDAFDTQHFTQLAQWHTTVSYWPRTYSYQEAYNSAVPCDWWILFNNDLQADLWLMRWPDNSRIVPTLLD